MPLFHGNPYIATCRTVSLLFRLLSGSQVSPEVSYVGSKVDHEGGFPTGVRYSFTDTYDSSRRGKKELKSSRDKNCKARTVVGRAGEEPAIILLYVTPDLSYD